MNVPIRMLGIATTIFWIILASFIASATYSMKDLNFGVGEPQFTMASDHELMLTLPVFIDNRGYYSLKDFNLTTIFSDPEGVEISRASTFIAVIPFGKNTTIQHNVTLGLNSMPARTDSYLFEDSNLTCQAMAGVNFAEIVPTQIAENLTFPWGAPFYNFNLGQPQIKAGDLTHVHVPVTFENHAAFDLTGNVTVKLYDGQDKLMAESQTVMNATKNSSYKGNLDFSLPLASVASAGNLNGHFEAYFSTPLFEYGPVMIPYG
jgi:hypothetical protein